MPYNTKDDDRQFADLDAAIRRNQELLDEQTVQLDDLRTTETERRKMVDDEQAAAIQASDGNCLFTLLFWAAIGVHLIAQVWT